MNSEYKPRWGWLETFGVAGLVLLLVVHRLSLAAFTRYELEVTLVSIALGAMLFWLYAAIRAIDVEERDQKRKN